MEYKIVFGGQVGAGKTTAIATISDIPIAKTEAKASDGVARLKTNTTVAMDYGMLKLPSGEKVHLFGTPGQERFKYMWEILTVGGLGLVLLIDNHREDPVGDMLYYLDAYKGFIRRTAVVVGITHMDSAINPPLTDYYQKLDELGINAPVYEVDARSVDDVQILLTSLLSILEMGIKQ